MKEQQIKNIRIYPGSQDKREVVEESVNAFHVQLIENRLNASCLTTPEKIRVVNGIISYLKAQEERGMMP